MSTLGLLEAIEAEELLGLKLHPQQRGPIEGFECTPNAAVAAGRRGARRLADEELGEADPDAGEGFIAGLDPGYASDSFGVALLGRSRDGSGLVLGPVRAIEPDAALRRDKSWEVKRDAQDRVTAQVVELCREYGAQAYTDQAVVARSRERGLKRRCTQ